MSSYKNEEQETKVQKSILDCYQNFIQLNEIKMNANKIECLRGQKINWKMGEIQTKSGLKPIATKIFTN